MKTIRELLQEGDPLRHEPTLLQGQREIRRQAVLAAAARSRGEPRDAGRRSWMAVFASVALVVVAASLFGVLTWSLFVRDLQAAIRFEVRLAEDKPAPGLQEAKVADSNRVVYLHNEVVVTNGDIASVRVIRQGNGSTQHAISVEFNKAGAAKMRAATASNIGKPLAILLDGQVVMAPVVRSPIEANAVITGKYTKAEAERMAGRIVKGIGIQ